MKKINIIALSGEKITKVIASSSSVEISFEKEEKETKKYNWKDIKTFEDACKILNIDYCSIVGALIPEDEIAYRKLKIIVKAINQGWEPDWNNLNQKKWYPYFKMSSGFGFSASSYLYNRMATYIGSLLYFENAEKAAYAGKQFQDIYEKFLK